MKLSIITINYNNACDLKQTIQSVIEQTWGDFEYLIIDGGSTDSSLEIIKQYQNQIDYWVSEPDKGVFHAMNKGIEQSSGEYLLMLNSGDCLANNKVLEKVFDLNFYTEDILAGDVFRAAHGKIFEKSYFPAAVSFKTLFNKAFCS